MTCRVFTLCKSQIRPGIEYSCHICKGAAQSLVSGLDRVPRNLGDRLQNNLHPTTHFKQTKHSMPCINLSLLSRKLLSRSP